MPLLRGARLHFFYSIGTIWPSCGDTVISWPGSDKPTLVSRLMVSCFSFCSQISLGLKLSAGESCWQVRHAVLGKQLPKRSSFVLVRRQWGSALQELQPTTSFCFFFFFSLSLPSPVQCWQSHSRQWNHSPSTARESLQCCGAGNSSHVPGKEITQKTCSKMWNSC